MSRFNLNNIMNTLRPNQQQNQAANAAPRAAGQQPNNANNIQAKFNQGMDESLVAPNSNI